MFQPCVYHQCKISKIIHPEILSEEVFGEFYTFSDYPSDIYASVSEDGSSSEHSSESDDVNIRPTKRQKTLVIDSDTEGEHETHHTREGSFASILCFG